MTHECKQEKCSFKKGSPLQGLCPVCSECGANAWELSETCVNCWNCENDEGVIRNGIPNMLTNKQKQKEQERIIEVKTQ